MISVVIVLVRETRTWHIRRCAINFGNARIRAWPCPTRCYPSQDAATEAMKRRAMHYLRQKGYTDSPLDIEWHIEAVDPAHTPQDPRHL